MTKDSQELAGVVGSREVAAYLNMIQQVSIRTLRADVLSGPILSTSEAVISYLRFLMGSSENEQLRILYLDGQNGLLREEVIATGSMQQVPVHSRSIIRQALNLGATALILVHNHPSGSAEPSSQDIEVTHRLAKIARELEVTVHDHLIVTRSSVTSLRARGLI
jgi:DNA repair protein RadC